MGKGGRKLIVGNKRTGTWGMDGNAKKASYGTWANGAERTVSKKNKRERKKGDWGSKVEQSKEKKQAEKAQHQKHVLG